MRLNIGAGQRRIPGWTGVDVTERYGAEIVADARSIPLPDNSVEEIMAIHLIEHFYKWQVPDALREWYRLLKPSGLLILELPDLIKSCRNILHPIPKEEKHEGQLGLWGLYGDPREEDPFMVHHWGWTFTTLRPLVTSIGFVSVIEKETEFHPRGKVFRDFRLEASKPI